MPVIGSFWITVRGSLMVLLMAAHQLCVYAVPRAQRFFVDGNGCTFDVQLCQDRPNLSLPHVTSGAPREDDAPHGMALTADCGQLGSGRKEPPAEMPSLREPQCVFLFSGRSCLSVPRTLAPTKGSNWWYHGEDLRLLMILSVPNRVRRFSVARDD
jgi:hypothetical protein